MSERIRADDRLDPLVVVAIGMVVATTLWGLVGFGIDLVLGTGPWLRFVGVAAGATIGLVLARRRATPVADDAAEHA